MTDSPQNEIVHPCHSCGYLPDNCTAADANVCNRFQRYLTSISNGNGTRTASISTGGRKRRIYLAGSWKNAVPILALQKILTADGHEVDCFASTETGRTSFSWAELTKALGCKTIEEASAKLAMMDAIDLLQFDRVKEAYLEDRRWLNWADTCIMVLPCGNSAHLEAGYAKGAGKDLIIFGEFRKGDRDVMYGFADAAFRENTLPEMLAALRGGA
jgi:hypothetical protein